MPFLEIEFFQYTKAFLEDINFGQFLLNFEAFLKKLAKIGDWKTIFKEKSCFFDDFSKIVIFVWIFLL